MWRIEYRVSSTLCTVWWSYAVQLSPVQKKNGDYRAPQNGWAGGQEPKEQNGFPYHLQRILHFVLLNHRVRALIFMSQLAQLLKPSQSNPGCMTLGQVGDGVW